MPTTSLHLNTERTLRGGEVQCLGLVRSLMRRGERAILLARPASPLLERARAEGIEVEPWAARAELDPLAALTVRRAIRRHGAQLVHAHTAHALMHAVLARLGLPSAKVVASRRVSVPLRSRFSVHKYRAADAVVAVCGATRDDLVSWGLDAGKVHAIHSGVDLARFERLPSRAEARARFGLDPSARIVGLVGALVYNKGHAFLLQALKRLADGGLRARACFAGDGPLRGELQSLARSLGVEVDLLGYLDEPAPAYRAFDLCVQASDSGEGSPGAIKEAAAAGTPVVATRVGGTEEILRDGVEAVIVPPGDIGALEQAVGALLREPERAQRLAAAAAERIRSFDMEAMAAAHVELYARLVGQDGRERASSGALGGQRA
jgi:glycosyltransferase involved in cell wall biosynthesis